jgi:bifunctional non-homologous end joining protein LigD
MLRHIRDRPLMMQRAREGLGGEVFYQKAVGKHFPEYVERVTVRKEKGTVTHPVARNPETIVYLAGQGTVSFHAWLSRANALDDPDEIIFDLDPPDEDSFGVVRRTALSLRALLEELGLPTFVKTSGGKGLHVVVPLDASEPYASVRPFADAVAGELVSRDPEALTLEGRKAARRGRLFVDTWRNWYAQTAVAPYSVRLRPGAPVATPIHWEELTARFRPSAFTVATVPKRLERDGDAWQGFARRARSLGKARRLLQTRSSAVASI